MSRGERLCGLGYAAVLFWVNAYICRDWFYHPTAPMNSLYGYWAALAESGGWLGPSWWPYWDFGIPFEFTSAPLTPALAAAFIAVKRAAPLMAVQAVSAIFYCAAPVSMFCAAWALTRAPGYSFLAALAYSLLSPSLLIAPDGPFSWAALLRPERFLLQAGWDETPRCAALTFLFVFVVFLVRFLDSRRTRAFVAASAALGLSMLASPLAAAGAALAVLSLLTARDSQNWKVDLAFAGSIALFAWALTARFLPPSLWLAMGAASAEHEAWRLAALKSLAGAAVVWLVLVRALGRWTKDWRVRFFVLWAFALSCGPALAVWLDRLVLPQAGRFRIEMDAALPLAVVFAARAWLDRISAPVKAAMLFAVLSFTGEQVVHHRRLAKDVLYLTDIRKTIEYRTSTRVARELPGVRVLLPGSIAHWVNAFAPVPQFAGSEGTTAYSQVQQRAMTAVYQSDSRVAVAWLKAYGAGAVVVSGPASKEYWKPFEQPRKFEGVLPALWTEDDVTTYRVPQRSHSLAHVIPEAVLGGREPAGGGDIAAVERYNTALDTPGLPEARLEWAGRNRLRGRAVTAPGQVVSIQISYHPGWRAAIDGRKTETHRDGLGLMWLRPDTAGEAVFELRYDGGWEWRLCAALSGAAVLAAAVLLVRGRVLR
jgi:hypothetical protein